jgi:dTDP-4-dehydrorhamnose 3,5-epimerase
MIQNLTLHGAKLLQIKLFQDERGFFNERYQKTRFTDLGLPSEFIQDNHSRSKPGVIRGLHYQHSPSQGKLVSVIRGRIWDVILDLRPSFPTYGKWEAVELNDVDGKLLWVPPGFAHGFAVLGSEPADVFYKVDAPYSPQTESGIAYNDPELKISWPAEVMKQVLVSKKDSELPNFSHYRQHPVFK